MADPDARGADSGAALAYSAARFVWHDLTSTDPRRALEFYQSMFGWTAEEIDGLGGERYLLLRVNGQPVGGIVHVNRRATWPSHWMSYVSVTDVDAAVACAQELGGRVYMQGTDIPPGRMAVIADPAGAEISLVRFDASVQGAESTHHLPGSFCWDELATHDTARSRRFYSDLLGWEWERTELEGWGAYWYALRGERQAAGMLALAAESPGPPAWLPYVLTTSVDESAMRARSLGATLLVEPTDIPDVGRFAVLEDPTRASIALYASPGAVQ